MRIFLVIDETNFYHPDYTADLIRHYGHDFVGAALVTKISTKNSIEKYLMKNWFYLKPIEILKLVAKKSSLILSDWLYRKSFNGKFYSVKSALKYFNIDFFEVENNINTPEYLQKIKAKMPDVIISSNSLFFGKELLEIPTLGCVNRHSGLLPSYGGLWPVFQAVRNNEPYVGITIHTMNNKIDKGAVLYQIEIPILKNDTVDSLYKQCFELSTIATIEALNMLNKNIYNQKQPSYNPSYFSFPTKEHWEMFRQTGKVFI
ncbi:formyltransferase family protein [Mucilaginibacter sp.]|uniref:formyltransferase family protein n=1 Tax=Mucilaginibacter sp. TaxID=1882438 RepID=UPI002ED2B4C6